MNFDKTFENAHHQVIMIVSRLKETKININKILSNLHFNHQFIKA